MASEEEAFCDYLDGRLSALSGMIGEYKMERKKARVRGSTHQQKFFQDRLDNARAKFEAVYGVRDVAKDVGLCKR